MHTKKLFMMVALVVLCAASAQAQAPAVTYRWDPPTTGSPVVKYVIQASSDGGATWSDYVSENPPLNVYVFYDWAFAATYVIRVAGVDAGDRQGPWSQWSDPYTTPDPPDPGPPGEPGKPGRI